MAKESCTSRRRKKETNIFRTKMHKVTFMHEVDTVKKPKLLA